MNIVDAHRYFDLLIDKVGSPYFTSSEKDLFLQRGQIDFVNQFFDKRDNKYSAEQNSFDNERLYPLIENVSVDSDNLGKVYYADINNNLSTGSFMYILGLHQQSSGFDNTCDDAAKNLSYSQYVRHNDLGPRLSLSLKKPTDNKPIHVYFNNYLQLYPNKEKSVEITVLRTPALVTIDDDNDTGTPGENMIDFDLPENTRNEILMFALRNAGINIRDTEFYQLITNQQRENT